MCTKIHALNLWGKYEHSKGWGVNDQEVVHSA